ncbi:MAG: hypothetical protein ACD_11C00105G0014 [uncultured bacterium]|nr:MAG: hypothetical protein ACD_11C00105G0014 [uncultured bacterium]HBR71365.1 hypothetical protein [Candidatus Moranbacteria bacterium]
MLEKGSADSGGVNKGDEVDNGKKPKKTATKPNKVDPDLIVAMVNLVSPKNLHSLANYRVVTVVGIYLQSGKTKKTLGYVLNRKWAEKIAKRHKKSSQLTIEDNILAAVDGNGNGFLVGAAIRCLGDPEAKKLIQALIYEGLDPEECKIVQNKL